MSLVSPINCLHLLIVTALSCVCMPYAVLCHDMSHVIMSYHSNFQSVQSAIAGISLLGEKNYRNINKSVAVTTNNTLMHQFRYFKFVSGFSS